MKGINKVGAALANVMLISAFVMVLGSTIASIAWSSYRMKIVNINAKNNFYSCEAIIEQLRVGFRNEMVECSKNTETDAESFKNFYSKYIVKNENGSIYHAETTDKPNNEGIYDMAKVVALIKSIDGETYTISNTYVDEETGYPYGYELTATVDGTELKATIQADQSYNNFTLTNTSVYFSGISVSLERNGYYNSISTDVRIGFAGEEVPTGINAKFNEFSLVAMGGLYISASAGGCAMIHGDMYLEAKEVTEGNYDVKNASALYMDGTTNNNSKVMMISTGNIIIINGNFTLENGAIAKFPNSTQIYINGDVSITGDSELHTAENTKIYITDGHQFVYNNNNDKEPIYIEEADFPKKSFVDFLEIGKDRELQCNIGKKSFFIGVNNPKLFGSEASEPNSYLYPDGSNVQFIFTTQTTSSLAGSKPCIVVFRGNTDTGDLTAFQDFYGIAIARKTLHISPQNGHDVVDPTTNQTIKAVELHSISSEDYSQIMNSTVVLNGLIPKDYQWGVNEVKIPVKYLFTNDGAITISTGATEDNEGESSGPVVKHTNLSIKYNNWIRE